MSNWFVEQRLAWIKESIEIFGSMRREHLMRKFGISYVQTSADMQAALAKWPNLMAYNRSTKQYELLNDLDVVGPIDEEQG